MKKIVIKTTAITLAILVVLVALVYGALALFAPLTLAKLYDGAGNYKLATVYYERQYEKTGDTADLYTLCLKLDEYSDGERAVTYLELLTDDDSASFNDFCASVDGENFTGRISTKEYLYGKLVKAVCVSKGVTYAVELADELTSAEYTDYNPFYVLIIDRVINLDTTELSFVKTTIEAKLSYLSGTALTNAQNDLQIIAEKLS